MAKHWIKLWIETLHDPKIATLPDWQWRRFVEFLMLAGMNDADGLLQPVNEMAWILRVPDTTLSEALHCLSVVGVVRQENDGSWRVVNFAKQQESPSAQRMRKLREKARHSDANSDGHSDSNSDGHSDGHSGGHSASASASSSASDSFSESLKRVLGIYESEIGAITALIAEDLQSALEDYSEEWVAEAIREAVASNVRSWKYCSAILQRWKRDGFKSKKPGSNGNGQKSAEDGRAAERDRAFAEAKELISGKKR